MLPILLWRGGVASIHAMIHREKLEKARELLACSSLNINEISQMCGYPP
jgi:LacI family transcriptional regulator